MLENTTKIFGVNLPLARQKKDLRYKIEINLMVQFTIS